MLQQLKSLHQITPNLLILPRFPHTAGYIFILALTVLGTGHKLFPINICDTHIITMQLTLTENMAVVLREICNTEDTFAGARFFRLEMFGLIGFGGDCEFGVGFLVIDVGGGLWGFRGFCAMVFHCANYSIWKDYGEIKVTNSNFNFNCFVLGCYNSYSQ